MEESGRVSLYPPFFGSSNQTPRIMREPINPRTAALFTGVTAQGNKWYSVRLRAGDSCIPGRR
jgi:hypothetical protein